MNQEVQQHLEEALNEVRAIYVKAATRIEALKPGEKIPATTLAEELARDIKLPDGKPMTGPQLYPTLKFLFKGYPGVEIARGAHGGIKRPAVVAAPVASPVVNDDDGISGV
jgi:hypothetical protein